MDVRCSNSPLRRLMMSFREVLENKLLEVDSYSGSFRIDGGMMLGSSRREIE
jgi:hypothetical protein